MLRPTSLKLFRSTGYSSILAPGETRLALHPGWLVLAVSCWIGFVCNVALWRALGTGSGLGWALTAGAAAAAVVGTLLSLFGWRRTLKATASLMLLLAAAMACGVWSQSLPVDTHLLDKGFIGLLPGWAHLLGWHTTTLLVMLALPPLMWVWQTPLRRLPGPTQLASNISGMVTGAAALAAASFVLAGLPF